MEVETTPHEYNPGTCDICQNLCAILIPKAGSGVEVSYLCTRCIEEGQIPILQEYIDKFGIMTEAL